MNMENSEVETVNHFSSMLELETLVKEYNTSTLLQLVISRALDLNEEKPTLSGEAFLQSLSAAYNSYLATLDSLGTTETGK